MGVEHVLRECTYECNMMSSPFYHASLPFLPPCPSCGKGVFATGATHVREDSGQTVCVYLRGTCTSVTEASLVQMYTQRHSLTRHFPVCSYIVMA